jgi:hypothetical protein
VPGAIDTGITILPLQGADPEDDNGGTEQVAIAEIRFVNAASVYRPIAAEDDDVDPPPWF